jgi:FtsZ-binding cell division protein ZapB
MLATQLTRRDDELKLVYEKYKIQQSTLSKGEVQYRSRLDDIRLLKMEIKRLKREKVILSKTVSNVEDLKKELHSAQRDLLRERTRCRALEEELETPINVHRWRKLEGTDPAMYEKIQKIQTLQKRLIAKTEETVEKEMILQQKEKEYLELKSVLARQPGPEVAEQLQVYQQAVKEKTRQLQSMASELNMFQAESTEYKYEIERLARELQDTKKRYFDTKRKELAVRDRNFALNASPNGMVASPGRYAGGGFKMTQD